MTHRLADATSPYLLQHKDNPVDWWEWSDEAFAEARERNVPVLLSVGYAACHWCQVPWTCQVPRHVAERPRFREILSALHICSAALDPAERSGELAGVGESEAEVAGCAFGERGREHWHLDVVVVVHFGGLLARMGSEDAAGVLDEASLERDWTCQEQGVECRAVEAFADEVARRDHKQRRIGIGWVEPPDGCGALLGAHAALEDDRVQPSLGECRGEVVDVAGSLGEDEAVAAATQGIYYIGEDLFVACLVFGERAVDACDGAWDG